MTIHGSVGGVPAETKRDNVKSITVRSDREAADRLTSEVMLGTIGGLSGDAPMLHVSAVALEAGCSEQGRDPRAVRMPACPGERA